VIECELVLELERMASRGATSLTVAGISCQPGLAAAACGAGVAFQRRS
jgi:hypothetical protein